MKLDLALAAAALGALAIGGSAAAAAAPARPTTLLNSGDPSLTLTRPLRGAGPAPAGSAAPNPDPRNFDGVWWLEGYEYMLGPEPAVPAPLKPRYMELLKARIRAKNAGNPEADASTRCFPHGMPRLMESPYPIEIVQTPGQVTLLHEVGHNVRRIWLNRPAPKTQPLTWLGYSEGRWEGDTLVVVTTRIKDGTFIDDEGASKSTALKTTERFRKVNGGEGLEMTITIDDPVTLEHPYSYKRYYHWRPDVRPMEYICEENNRNAPVNGVTVAQ